MVKELENIKELENELLKVRLTITEKGQEKEKAEKTMNAWMGVGGFFGFLTLLTFFGENKLLVLIPGSILGIAMFFGFKKSFVISRCIQKINLAKKEKKTIRE